MGWRQTPLRWVIILIVPLAHAQDTPHSRDELCLPGEIDYPAMQVNFSMYMQNLVHRDVTWWKSDMMSHSLRQLAQADGYMDERNPAEACPEAVACAKLMTLLVMSPEDQYQALNSVGSGVQQVLGWLYRNGIQNTLELIDSGWPVVTLFGKLERVSIDYFAVFASSVFEREEWTAWADERQRLEGYLERFEHVPLKEAMDLITRLLAEAQAMGAEQFKGSMRLAWHLAMASGYLAMADTTRLLGPSALVGTDASQAYARTALEHLDEVLKWISQGVLSPFLALASGWPTFRLMDRLTTYPVHTIRLPSTSAVVHEYKTHIFPLHEKVSDYVRICSMPYCDLEFAQLMIAVHESQPPEETLWLVEVGTNLGDCSLWAMAQLGPQRLRVVAFEPLAESAALVRKSVVDNGWQDAFEVVQKAVTDRAGKIELFTVGARLGNPFAHATTSTPVTYEGAEEAFSGFYTDKVHGAPTKYDVEATPLDMALPEVLLQPNAPPIVLKAVVFNETIPVLLGAKHLFARNPSPVVAFSALLLKEYADDMKAQIDFLWQLFDGYVIRMPQMAPHPLNYQELVSLAMRDADEAFVFVAHKPVVNFERLDSLQPQGSGHQERVTEACLWGESVQQRQNRLSGQRGLDTYFL